MLRCRPHWTGSAAVWVRLADDDRRLGKLGASDGVEASTVQTKLIAQVQLHLVFDQGHATFGVKAHHVEARARLPGDGIRPCTAVLQELAEKGTLGPGYGGAAQRGGGEH